MRVTPLRPPQLWELAEFRVGDGPTAPNPFDPEAIRLDATVTPPSGKAVVIPAFWYQDFKREQVKGAEVLTSVGEPEWRIRFTPTESGDHSLTLAAKLGGGAAPEPVTIHFNVASKTVSHPQGWVRTGADHRYFETSDGQPLRLIGENVCWYERGGTFDFDAWFEQMEKSGQNFARIWCAPWCFALEHTPKTLNRYDQGQAWQLDYVFQLAARHGIYLLLCFDHHGMYQTDNQNWGGSNNFWKTNPYNKVSGGPCAEPNDFFTDPTAQALYQKRLRYLIARYGGSSRLLAWQFFNEIDNVYAPRQSLQGADVATWHRVMGQWLHTNDPFHHLVTTSLTGGSDRPELWNLPEMDFTMYHSYGDPAPGRWIAGVVANYLKRYNKPVMIGEFGVSAQSWALKTDPHLRGFRQALWSGALSGSVGSTMSWWWQDMHIQNVYTLYDAMTRILRKAEWQDGAWMPIAFTGARVPPTQVDAVKDGEGTFTATFALSSYRRTPLSGEVAVADPLSAERGSEALCSYFHGSNNSTLQKPIKLHAYFGPDAKLVFHVNSVASDVEIIVQIDGAEVFRTRIFDRDGQNAVNGEINKEFVVRIPPGKHEIQMTNASLDWAYLDALRLDGVQAATFAKNWDWPPEPVGLRKANEGKAVLYLYSPYVVYPAGAFHYHPPALAHQTVTLPEWPAGRFNATWYSPVTGEEVARTEAETAQGVLTLPLPALRDDLAAVVTPAK